MVSSACISVLWLVHNRNTQIPQHTLKVSESWDCWRWTQHEEEAEEEKEEEEKKHKWFDKKLVSGVEEA